MALELIRNQNDEPVPGRHGSVVNWGAIFGGAFASVGMGFISLVLGNAIGLGVVNQITGASTGLVVGSWIYNFAMISASFFVGCLVMGRLGGFPSRLSGAMHGIVAWSMASVFLAYVGILTSLNVRITLAGVGINSLNWLLFCTAFVSMLAAAFGGLAGARQKAVTSGEIKTREVA